MSILSDVALAFAKRSALLATAVLVAEVIGCWSPAVGFLLFMLGLLIVPCWIVAIACLGSAGLWRRLDGRVAGASRAFLTTVVFVAELSGIGSAVPALWLARYLGDETLLIAYRAHYRAIVAKAQVGPPPPSGWQRDGPVTYSVTKGTPRRVAFEPAGMLDNWSGTVWDPTQDVMKADGFDPVTGRFRAPERITKLFGGDLVGCRRLGGDWFDCSFT